MNYLTFDIEEWYLSGPERQVSIKLWDQLESRVVSSTRKILQMLREQNVKAHFFLMGWVMEKSPFLFEEILKDGHTLGFHSWWHYAVYQQNDDAFEEELVKGLDFFEHHCGFRPITYRAPFFSMDQRSLSKYEILIRQGIRISSSMKAGIELNSARCPNEPFWIEVKNNLILEMPLNRRSIFGLKIPFSGSGYFRILPEDLIHHLIKKSAYTMSYFHPRDLDFAIPEMPDKSHLRNWMNKRGLKHMDQKFNHLLNSYSFHSLLNAEQDYAKHDSGYIYKLSDQA